MTSQPVCEEGAERRPLSFLALLYSGRAQPRQNIPIQHAHPTVVVAMDLAVLVAQGAAVAVGDGIAVAGVADVDCGLELAAPCDLVLHQL